MEQEKKHISVIACVLIKNKDNKYLFVKSNNFGGKWWLPGGHVKYSADVRGEALREVKEETGLDIDDVKLLGNVEVIEPDDYKAKEHFIVFYFEARVGDNVDMVLDKDELSKAKWMSIEKIKKQDNISSLLQEILADMETGGQCNSCTEYKAGWARAQADYQNLVRETEEKKKEYMAWSKQMILEDFIPVYDNFKKAFNTQIDTDDNANIDADNKFENWKKGIEFIMKQYGKVLEDHGVSEMKTVGEMFDPSLHEAVGEEESDEAEGIILREVDAGYRMGEKVVKVAKVVVSK